MISSLIAERRATGPRDDLLSLLLAAQEDGAGMTDTQVRDEAVTLFLAGHETTSVTGDGIHVMAKGTHGTIEPGVSDSEGRPAT